MTLTLTLRQPVDVVKEDPGPRLDHAAYKLVQYRQCQVLAAINAHQVAPHHLK